MILSSWFRFQCPEWPGGEKIQKENLQQVQSQKKTANRRKTFTCHSELSRVQAGSALCINWEMVESSIQSYVHATEIPRVSVTSWLLTIISLKELWKISL